MRQGLAPASRDVFASEPTPLSPPGSDAAAPEAPSDVTCATSSLVKRISSQREEILVKDTTNDASRFTLHVIHPEIFRFDFLHQGNSHLGLPFFQSCPFQFHQRHSS